MLFFFFFLVCLLGIQYSNTSNQLVKNIKKVSFQVERNLKFEKNRKKNCFDTQGLLFFSVAIFFHPLLYFNGSLHWEVIHIMSQMLVHSSIQSEFCGSSRTGELYNSEYSHCTILLIMLKNTLILTMNVFQSGQTLWRHT